MHPDVRVEDLRLASAMLKHIGKRTSAAGEDLLSYLIDIASAEADERVRSLQSESRLGCRDALTPEGETYRASPR